VTYRFNTTSANNIAIFLDIHATGKCQYGHHKRYYFRRLHKIDSCPLHTEDKREGQALPPPEKPPQVLYRICR
jgi:hypothetical protein